MNTLNKASAAVSGNVYGHAETVEKGLLTDKHIFGIFTSPGSVKVYQWRRN